MYWQYFIETLNPTNFKEMERSKSIDPTFTFDERASEYDVEAEIGSERRHDGFPLNIYLDIRGGQGWELIQMDNTNKFYWTFYFKRDFQVYEDALGIVTDREAMLEADAWTMPNPHENDD